MSAPAHDPSAQSLSQPTIPQCLHHHDPSSCPYIPFTLGSCQACEHGVQLLLPHCPEYLPKCHLGERHLVSSEGQPEKQPFNTRCGISRQDLQESCLCLYRMFLFMGLQENLVSALSAKQSGASEHWVYFKLMASKLCN